MGLPLTVTLTMVHSHTPNSSLQDLFALQPLRRHINRCCTIGLNKKKRNWAEGTETAKMSSLAAAVITHVNLPGECYDEDLSGVHTPPNPIRWWRPMAQMNLGVTWTHLSRRRNKRRIPKRTNSHLDPDIRSFVYHHPHKLLLLRIW